MDDLNKQIEDLPNVKDLKELAKQLRSILLQVTSVLERSDMIADDAAQAYRRNFKELLMAEGKGDGRPPPSRSTAAKGHTPTTKQSSKKKHSDATSSSSASSRSGG